MVTKVITRLIRKLLLRTLINTNDNFDQCRTHLRRVFMESSRWGWHNL